MPDFNRFYEACAPYYDRIFTLALDVARKRAVTLADIRPSQRVLEVGVGTGLTARFYPQDSHVTGIDFSDDMLQVARERMRTEPRSPLKELIQMDAHHLEFDDESFDVVLGAHFLSATPKPARALEEMRRVCKKDGTIVLVNSFQSPRPVLRSLQKAVDPVTRHIGFSIKLNLENLARETGLRVRHRERVHPLFPVEAVLLGRE